MAIALFSGDSLQYSFFVRQHKQSGPGPYKITVMNVITNVGIEFYHFLKKVFTKVSDYGFFFFLPLHEILFCHLRQGSLLSFLSFFIVFCFYCDVLILPVNIFPALLRYDG